MFAYRFGTVILMTQQFSCSQTSRASILFAIYILDEDWNRELICKINTLVS